MAARFPPAFAAGLRCFNRGDYFAAHEAFEALLDAVEHDRRWDLLVALVQVAVGYHKAAAGHPGAARMLGLGLEKLAAFPAVAWGLDVAALRARVTADVARLAAGGDAADLFAPDPPRLVMRAQESV
jgi:predicted metal-dependent hydrolase